MAFSTHFPRCAFSTLVRLLRRCPAGVESRSHGPRPPFQRTAYHVLRRIRRVVSSGRGGVHGARHLEFLDKEVFTDIASSERHEVDLLVKAQFRGGSEGCFLVHVENQASAQENSRDGCFGILRACMRIRAAGFPSACFHSTSRRGPNPIDIRWISRTSRARLRVSGDSTQSVELARLSS